MSVAFLKNAEGGPRHAPERGNTQAPRIILVARVLRPEGRKYVRGFDSAVDLPVCVTPVATCCHRTSAAQRPDCVYH